MQIGSFLDLARRRRSIRRFKPDPIPDEYVHKILEAARWAMSGGNGQPWEFIVIKDQETKDKLAALRYEHGKMTAVMESSRVPEIRHSHHPDPQTTASPLFKDAPVIIALIGDFRTVQASVLSAQQDGLVFYRNMANACHMMQLAAAALGLGAQWVSIISDIEGEMKSILGVPLFFRLLNLVPVGYPAYEPKPPYRRELEEIVHYGKYDMSKYRSDEDILKFIIRLREDRREPTERFLKPYWV